MRTQVQGRGEPSGDRIQVHKPAAQGSGDGLCASAAVPLRDSEKPSGERHAARASAKRPGPPTRQIMIHSNVGTATTYHIVYIIYKLSYSGLRHI